MNHQEFLNAIQNMSLVKITFKTKESNEKDLITRTCAPMDYGPSKKDGITKYHFWDYNSDEGPHPLSLTASQIIRMIVLEDQFEPSGFVTWKPNWIIKRNWGRYS